MDKQLKSCNTLFLDRDGVINERPGGGYVTEWSGFHFLPGVLEALKIFNPLFKRIVVVTNQQGIGKNLMTVNDLDLIHTKMLETIKQHGGHIDAVYFCPDLATKPNTCRKPGINMARRAQNHFPDIEFGKSIMAGDTGTDMRFGRNVGMISVLIGHEKQNVDKALIDFQFNSLIEFANYLSAND